MNAVSAQELSIGHDRKTPPHSSAHVFDYQPRTRVVFGVKTVERVGHLAAELGASKVLLVTDPGIVAAGHAQRVIQLLHDAGLHTAVFDSAVENPTTTCVKRCMQLARSEQIDFIIGLGGGSSLDTAKGCNFLLTNGGNMRDYLGIGKARHPMLPFLAIPTTAGTGSECQSFALITDETTHQKMACGDPKAAARIAILDPELTVSQPPGVTACTGMDAITHALESAVTRKRNPIPSMFSCEAFRLTMNAFPRVLREPSNIEARGAMLLGAAFAGMAIENSMLGAAHSAANPLTAHYGIVHGQAVGVMLPGIVRLNARDHEASAIYDELVHVADLRTAADHSVSAGELIATRLEGLLEAAALGADELGLNLTPEEIGTLSSEAARQWTAQFNPCTVSETEFQQLYADALGIG